MHTLCSAAQLNPSTDFALKPSKDSFCIPCWRRRAFQAQVASILHADATEDEKVCFLATTATTTGTHYKAEHEETEEKEKEKGLLLMTEGTHHEELEEKETEKGLLLIAKGTHRKAQDEETEEKEKEKELLLISNCSHGSTEAHGTHYRSQNEETAEEKQDSSATSYQKQVHCQEDDDREAFAVVALLNTYTKQKDLLNGNKLHADIVTKGLLQTNVFVGSAVVNMYAKLGSFLAAQEVFDTLGVRDVVAWNALIAGYTQHGRSEEAWNSFEHMQLEGVSPNAITFASILKACISSGAVVDRGQEIHARLVREGLLEEDVVLGTALVDFYARIGFLGKAQEIFDKISNPNVVSWTVLVGGYAHYGQCEEALACYKRMQFEGVSPSAYTFIWVLKASASIGAIGIGQKLHSQIVKEGFLLSDMFVGTALVDMYAKCGLLAKAQEVCDELPFRDAAAMNALIAGYTQHGHGEKALHCFEQMQLEGLSPDRVTFASVLKACGSIGAIDKGQDLQDRIITEGWLEKDKFISASLVDMFIKCGLLGKAQEVFDKLPVQDVVSLNALITGYTQQGYGEEALICYERNRHKALLPDAITFVSILNACSSMGAVDKGEKIHAEIVKYGLPAEDIVAFNALMDMYAKCGLLEEAQRVFNNLLVQDVVSWNTIITGFAHHGHDEESLDCFELMQREGFSPSLITFACIFKTCGSMGAANKGQALHAEIVQDGLLETDLIIGTSMVDMYANCGMLAEAQEIFDKLSGQSVITWNALIAAYTQLGDATPVYDYFQKMINEGIMPDSVTFTILLNTCSHAGLLDMGQAYFEMMSTCYGIVPTLEHYTCMIDLFGRAGHINPAVALIKEMPISASLMIWHTLLRACRKFKTFKLAKSVFEHAAESNEMDAAAYICLKNIYVDAGREENSHLFDSISEETGRDESAKLLV